MLKIKSKEIDQKTLVNFQWCSGDDSRRGCLSCKHYNSSYVCQLHQFEHWAGSSCDDWVLDENRFEKKK